jgi:hypothetical protein
MRSRYPVAIALVLAAISCPTPASAATCVWTPTQLPLPATMTQGAVRAVDSRSGYAGEATRFSTTPGGDGTTHVVRWSGGTTTDYGTVPGFAPYAWVSGVNKYGLVVGHTSAATGYHERAFRSVGTALRPLPEPAGASHSWATAVNDNGDIVGHTAALTTIGGSSYQVNTAVLWPASAPGTVVKLTGLPTTGQTTARGIDQDGTILVEHFSSLSYLADAETLYLWRAGTARALATPAGTSAVVGNAISNGRVVGASTYRDYRGVGALWEQDGALVQPTASSHMTSINRTGQSVGWQETAPLIVTYSVWQGTAKVGTFSGNRGIDVSADDGTVGGWTRADPNAPKLPASFRCV